MLHRDIICIFLKVFLGFRVILTFFNVIFAFLASGDTWEARASLRHTNLTRRIDPHDPEGLESPKLKKSVLKKRVFLRIQVHIPMGVNKISKL